MAISKEQPLRPYVQELGADFDELAESVQSGDIVSVDAVQAFDTVADMQAATTLVAGMTCHTNGNATVGDGGAAYYTVGTSGDIACQNGLYASEVNVSLSNATIDEITAGYTPSRDGVLDETGLSRFWDNIQDQIGSASQEQVDAWLDEHPEATTTVQDGAITIPKLANEVKEQMTDLDSFEILSGKYASYTGSTVQLYDVANAGCIKIPVSAYVGGFIRLNVESLNTTYNICYLLATEANVRISSLKTTGATDYSNVYVTVPSNAAYLYVNFNYTGGIVRASAKKLILDVPIIGIIHCAYPIITLNTIAKTIQISNVVNGTASPVYLSAGWKYFTLASGATQINQSLSGINNGTLAFDTIDNMFAFLPKFIIDDRNRYVWIASFINGTVSDTASRIITIANENKHAKKSMVCYGDSLTWYDGQQATWGPDQGTTIVGFESYLRAYLNLSVTNAGQSGQTLPQICARMVSDSVPRNMDIVMLMGGNNDDRLGVSVGTLLPQGSTFNTSTTIGAMQNAIETVLTANPTATLILATEPMGWTWNGSSLERVDDVYPNAIRQVAELYGLPLLDLWKISGVNEMTRNTMYLDPPDTENQQYMYHPNNYGWKVISERIIQFMQML